MVDERAFVHLDTTALVLDRRPSEAFVERYVHMAGVTRDAGGRPTS